MAYPAIRDVIPAGGASLFAPGAGAIRSPSSQNRATIWRKTAFGAVFLAGAVSAAAAPVRQPSPDEINQSPTLRNIVKRQMIVSGSLLKYVGFNWKNPTTGVEEGFCADIGRALAEYMLGDPNKIEWHYTGGTTGSGSVLFVVRGDVDVIIDPTPKKPEFKLLVNMSDDILISGAAFLVPKGSSFRGLDDVTKSTKVIYHESGPEIGFVMEKHPDATYLPSWDLIDEVDALTSGVGDVYTAVYPSLVHGALLNPNLKIVGRYTDSPCGLVSRKDDPVFAAYLNRFVGWLKGTGRWDKLFDKWLSPLGVVRDHVGRTVESLPPPRTQARAEPMESPTLKAIQKRGMLIVGNSFKFRQFAYPSPEFGDPQGYMAEIAHDLAKDILGDPSKVIWRKISNEDDIHAVDAGAVDVIIDVVYVGPHVERPNEENFSKETFRSGSAMLVPKGSPIQSFSDLTNRSRILWVTGGERDLRHLKLHAPDATFVEFHSFDDAFAALKSGKGDLLNGYVPYLYAFAVQDTKFTLIHRYTERPTGIVSRKDDPGFSTRLDQFVSAWKKSGESERLYQKWFVAYGGNMVR